MGLVPFAIEVAAHSGVIRFIGRSSGEVETCLGAPHGNKMHKRTPFALTDVDEGKMRLLLWWFGENGSSLECER